MSTYYTQKAEWEKGMLSESLNKNNGNQTRVATELGLSRATIRSLTHLYFPGQFIVATTALDNQTQKFQKRRTKQTY